MLLLRHRSIDAAVELAISQGAEQVLEIAGGLTGRSLRLGAKHPHVRFVEGDLPGMVAEKRRRLAKLGHAASALTVRHVDFLEESGPHSIGGTFAECLDPTKKTVVVTEGLLTYLDRTSVEAAWARIARAMLPAGGWYISELHPRSEIVGYRVARVFLRWLAVVARGRIELHHDTAEEAIGAAKLAGFDSVDAKDANVWLGGETRTPLIRVLFAEVRSRKATGAETK
ncbi:MAG: O-methyltransferase involved in polyketide biosynthesis [Bradymonadia bacterium]|jgi:O-methyltransferase involved in polyketide biosynthesis